MATTTNFGWETPDDTDLVKDGAAAMRTLGNAIDTSFVDLKGGTTGQILSKASNSDLDYAWITNDVGDITAVTAGTGITGGGTSGAVTITNDMATTITAAGDIVVGTGSGTYDNLPIGTTGQVLTADTTVSPYKVKWASAGSSFKGCILTKGADQSISNASFTDVTWGAEDVDTDGFHSTVTNTARVTIPTGLGGKYLFSTLIYFSGNATGARIVRFYKNGTTDLGYTQIPVNSGSYGTGMVTVRILDLAAGDYVTVNVYQNSGGALDVSGSISRFDVVYLGA